MSKKIKIGNIFIGGGEDVKIQSMLNVPTKNAKKCIEEILSLEKLGCEIVRVAVPDEESALAIEKIKENIHIPLVADIHFDHRLAIASINAGVDKVRINPGNIGSVDGVKKVAHLAKEKNVPIRIGVNGGSLEKEILAKYINNSQKSTMMTLCPYSRRLRRFVRVGFSSSIYSV